MITKDHTVTLFPHKNGFEVVHSFQTEGQRKRTYLREVFPTESEARARMRLISAETGAH